MIIRQARAADIPALVALRMELFCEVGELVTPQADPALWQATLDYFTRAMSEERALSWLAEADTQEGCKQIVAAGTLALFERPPYPGNLAGMEGYLLNMYTRPQWRQQGSPRRCSMPLQPSPDRASWARCGSMPASRGALSMSGSVLSPIRPIWSGTWHLNRWAPVISMVSRLKFMQM